MKTLAKWILGILIGLIVIAALATVAYLVFNWWGGGQWMMNVNAPRFWGNERDFPWDEMPRLPGGRMPMHPGGRMPMQPGYQMPMHPGYNMPGYGWGGFSWIGTIFNGLICVGLLALIALGVVALVRGLNRSQPAVAAAPVTQTVSSMMPESAPTHACPNCSRMVNDDWSHCPYCGHTLTGA